jgi:hypothetical protein
MDPSRDRLKVVAALLLDDDPEVMQALRRLAELLLWEQTRRQPRASAPIFSLVKDSG